MVTFAQLSNAQRAILDFGKKGEMHPRLRTYVIRSLGRLDPAGVNHAFDRLEGAEPALA
jgi:hypothetical protein